MAMSAEAKAAVVSLFVFIAVVMILPLAERPDDFPLEFDLSSLSSQVPALDADKIAEEVSSLVKLNTISNDEDPSHLSKESQATIKESHAQLKTMYPTLFSTAKVETVNDFSLLLSLEGTDPQLKPAMVICHLDVVPIEEGTWDDWGRAQGCPDCSPFSGKIHGGYVWGRGALDMKSWCVSFLHAAEKLLTRPQGFRPARTIMMGIGHDEEVGGTQGHKEIASLLKQRGIEELEFLLDEGMPIMKAGELAMNPDFDIALIGTAEKGFVSVELSVEYSGGHAAYPDEHGTSVSLLARAVDRIQSNPPPPTFQPPMSDMIRAVAPHSPFPLSFIGKRLSFFGPLVARLFTSTPKQNALVRTTTAATMFSGGTKDNVLPQRASAVINHRILPGETVEQVVQRDRETIGDERVKVSMSGGARMPPSQVSDPTLFGFKVIAGSIRQVWPSAVVAPALFIAASDSKHYERTLAPKRVYRHYPFVWTNQDLSTIHSTDERVAVASLAKAATFFSFFFLAASTSHSGSPFPSAAVGTRRQPTAGASSEL